MSDEEFQAVYADAVEAPEPGEAAAPGDAGTGGREPRDWKRTYDENLRRASAGDPRAMTLVAIMQSKGLGTTQDEQAALMWATEAANQQEGTGQVELGKFYRDGVGTEKNEEAARAIFGSLPQEMDALRQRLQANPNQTISVVDVLGALTGRTGGGGGDGGSGGGGVSGGTLLGSLFGDARARDATTVAEAMRQIEERGRRVRALYDTMAAKNDYRDTLKPRELCDEWIASLPVLERLAKGTSSEAEILRGSAALRDVLKKELREATKDGRKNAIARALDKADGAVRTLREAVGVDPGPAK
ncbi:MAG: hypothetical protein SFY69_06235 [Planctomycetota bacterium]|nr:hypothetical protein [Planctomycetota bacterium]